MADVRPINALHYDLAKVGSLDAVAAPPYDVIDAAGRQALLARSPYNAVAIDLPKPFDPADPDHDAPGDPYARARETMDRWRSEGALVADAEPAYWALTQDYDAPDGNSYSRHGILCRVRVEDYESGTVRPHERTHPGPLVDRLELTRATLHNLSPIFSLSTEDAWPLVEPAVAGRALGRSDRRGRHRQPRLAGRRPGDRRRRHRAPRRRPAADRRRPPPLRDRPRLPRRGRRRGPVELHADVADRARRPRPARLPHPPPAHRFGGDAERMGKLGAGLRELFDAEEVSREEIDPAGEEGVGVFGLYDSFHKQAYRLRLKDVAALDRRLEGKPEAYRRLDSAILETLVLKGLAGMSDHDIDARNGLEYAKTVERRARPGRRRRVRRRPDPAPGPGRAGQGGRRNRREHAAEVDLLLPQGDDRPRLQPGRLRRAPGGAPA